MKAPGASNVQTSREGWMHAADDALRPYFASCGLTLPEKIRYAIAFPSTGRKGRRVGETWHSSSSDDDTFEVFVRADLDEPVKILEVLVKQLVHACLPNDAGHGKLFKAAAIRVGLQPPMRQPTAGVLLENRLKEVAAALGPMPHKRLHIEQSPLVAVAPVPAVALGRPKKQRARMIKAECPECAKGPRPYIVRIAASTAREIGPPHCPVHGEMAVDFPPDDETEEVEGAETERAFKRSA